MQGKHIVFFDQYGSLGGGQQVLLELVRAAQSLGHGTTVLLPDGPCVDKLRDLGAEVVSIPPFSFTQGKKTIWDILKLLFWNIFVVLCNVRLLSHCDLIYVNGLRLLPVAMLAQRFLRRRATCHVHLNHGPRELALIRRFLQHPLTQAVVAPSPFIQRQLLAFDPAFQDSRVRLVENGLDVRFTNIPFVDRFTDKALQHVAIVGRISPEKGQDVLPVLARQFPEMTFHVLGDAAFSEYSFAERVSSACPDNVIWHGWIDDLPAKVAELGIQLALVPSRNASSGTSFEAAPLVPIQMLALSCLVVVRRLGALEDLANRLQLRNFSSDDDLVTTLRLCQATPMKELADEMVASRQKVMADFSNTALQDRFSVLLQTLLSPQART